MAGVRHPRRCKAVGEGTMRSMEVGAHRRLKPREIAVRITLTVTRQPPPTQESPGPRGAVRGAFGMLPRAPFGEAPLIWGGQAARGEFCHDAAEVGDGRLRGERLGPCSVRRSYWNSLRISWRALVGDRQRLDAELLLGLQRLQLGRGRVHVGVDEAAMPVCRLVDERGVERARRGHAVLGGADRRCSSS